MNRFLASALGAGNALLAWVIILAPALVGGLHEDFGGFAGFLGGLILGGMLAILVCGALALLIDIRNSLRELCEKQGSA